MILKLLVLLAAFIAVGIVAHEYIPFLLRRHSEIQSQRMEKAAKSLKDQVIVAEEKRRLLTLFTIIPLALALAGFLFLHNIIGAGVGFAVGLILPPILVKNIPLKRRKKFQQQFVDALMLVSSSLKAGLNLIQAFEILAEELPAPIGEEFSLLVKENKMGLPLEECLLHLKQRMPLEDLGMVVTAVNIAQETGGDLTEVFDELVVTVTEKRKLEDRVMTLTVQGRLQGVIMGILPIAFAVFVFSSNPHSFDIMLQHPVGQSLLVWAVISEIIGTLLIQKLSKVEV